MPGEHAELLALTHDKFIAGRADETTRRLPELALLKSKGNINFGVTGTAQVWAVKYKERDLEGHQDMALVTFSRKAVSVDATLAYKAEYTMTDAISWGDERKNRGKEALLRMYDDKAKDMVRDARNGLARDLYINGAATGNERKIDGIETMFGQSGTADANEFMINSGTFENITTTKGTYGGSSAADPEYDFWSALGVNVVTGSKTWAADADEMLRKAIANTQYANTPEDLLDLFSLRKASYLQLLEILEGKERWINTDTNLRRLGFPQQRTIAINFDGVDVAWSDAVPATDGDGKTVHGYGWNFDYFSLEWLADKLFDSGSTWDESQMAYRFWLIAGGNLKCTSPRHQCKLAAWPD